MTTRRVVVLAAVILCLAGFGLAQDEELPIRNWSAPPFWNPAVHPRAEAELSGGMLAHAQGMQAESESLPSSPLPFVAIAPCRIVDTRTAVSDGFHQPNFIDGEARTFPFPASTDCSGLPATAGAWSLNIQFRPISQLSYLTAYPTGTTMPTVSTLTAGPAAWVQNSAIVPAGTSGSIDIYCQYAGRVVIDINGYYGPQSVVTSLTAAATSLTGDVKLDAGSNVVITPSGQTFTIAATGGPGGELPVGSTNQTLRHDGKVWAASSALTNNGTNVSIANDLLLPDTSSGGSSGVITFGGSRFLHNYGVSNTFVGENAGNFTMTGSYNVATGFDSLSSNTTGSRNTASGYQSVDTNNTGSDNTATGYRSLYSNATGNKNTAVGSGALYTQAYYNGGTAWDSLNTAVGYHALYANQPTSTSSGYQNTAVGAYSLPANSTGSGNTAVGYISLHANTTGGANAAFGDDSMFSNTTGDGNTAVGYQSLFYNTGGGTNTAVGYWAGSDNTTGIFNTFVGAYSQPNSGALQNATALGYLAEVDASNHIRIGNTSVTQIGGAVPWSNLSDARAKTSIRDLDLGLDFVMNLRPVAFALKSGDGRTAMGFLAQDVEALVGDGYSVLGIGGDPDRTLSLRYTDLIAPLVKAVQEQQALIEAKDARITALEELQAAQQAEIAGLKAQRAVIEELRRQVRALMAPGATGKPLQVAGN